jgi:hypothetical protein
MTGDINPADVPNLIVAGVPTVLAGGVLTNGDPADWHVADAAPVVDTGVPMYTATVDQFSAFVLLTPRYALATSVVGEGSVAATPEQPVNGYWSMRRSASSPPPPPATSSTSGPAM